MRRKEEEKEEKVLLGGGQATKRGCGQEIGMIRSYTAEGTSRGCRRKIHGVT